MAPSFSLSTGSTLPSIHLASSVGLATAPGFIVGAYCLYCVAFAVYQLYISPLRKIPGPRLWIAFPVFRHFSAVRGNLDIDCRSFFDKYKSDAIRVAPNEVYFNNAAAWQDIYGHGRTPQLPKPMRRVPGEPHNIINANDVDHTRFRKTLAHAFSDKALREQEDMLQTYTSLLIQRLTEFASGGQPANMTRYYNFTTFDIIGDLSFGRSFDCLSSNGYHWWVTNIISFIKNTTVIRAQFEYPLLMKVFMLFQTKDRQESRADTWQLARDRVNARRNDSSQKDRKDFIDFMEKHKGDSDEISNDEMVSNMLILMLAGSETTASLLSGVTYWLLSTPHALARVTDEILSTFKCEQEITIQAVTSKLPYTIACLEEALRIYPPAPSVFPRMTLEEEIIAGQLIPAKTHVGVHQTGTYWSETNFTRPKEYLPERWLTDAKENPKSEFYHDNRKAHEPFHVGPRNCIGRNLALAEMRLILTRIIWNFEMELCDGMDDWVEKQKSYLIWLKGDLNVRLKKRKVSEKQR